MADRVLSAIAKAMATHPKQAMNLMDAYENSHPGGDGMTIVQILTKDVDEAYKEREDEPDDGDNVAFLEGYLEGLCRALGVMRSSSTQHEMDKAGERYGRTHGARR